MIKQKVYINLVISCLFIKSEQKKKKKRNERMLTMVTRTIYIYIYIFFLVHANLKRQILRDI